MPQAVKSWRTLSPAIIGFLGVIVGASISTGANYVLAVRKENADAARYELLRAQEFKVSARLITGDFAAAIGSLDAVLQLKVWLPGMAGGFQMSAWQRDAAVMARELSREEWQLVSSAAHAAEVFRMYPKEGEVPPLDAAQQVRAKLQAGINALQPYV